MVVNPKLQPRCLFQILKMWGEISIIKAVGKVDLRTVMVSHDI